MIRMDEKKRKYMREYYREYWKKYPEKYQRHKDYVRKKQRLRKDNHSNEHCKELKNKLRLEFGNKCFLCKYEKKLSFHEVNGNKHPIGNSTPYYIRKHPKDFVLVCYRCHRGLHFCMNMLRLTWQQILSLKEKCL